MTEIVIGNHVKTVSSIVVVKGSVEIERKPLER
jgi:hypothetical protein